MEQGISGQEGVEAFITLVESLQTKDDYGAYETTYGTLRRFPAGVAARGLVASLPRSVSAARRNLLLAPVRLVCR